MLVVENLSVSYDRIRALHGISFKIDEGEIACIIGANGAGKSTALRAISRLVPVEPGTRLTYKGENLLRYPADKVVNKLGISHVPEGRRIFDNLTVMENLRLATFGRKDGSNKIEEDLERLFAIFPRLEERKIQKGGTLSGGEQQMLAIGRALMSDPVLMLLDEPSLGLAPIVVEEILRVICELRQQGVTIVLVEQNVRAALEISDRGYVMELGSVVFEGDREKLLRDEKVKKAYIGKY